MKRGALLLVVMVAATVAAFFMVWETPEDPARRALDDSAFVLDGRSTTCTALFRKPCDYETQLEYNRRGTDLDKFVDSADLGPWGNSLPFADAAELALQACVYSRTAGKKRSSNSSSWGNAPTRTPDPSSSPRSGAKHVRNCVPHRGSDHVRHTAAVTMCHTCHRTYPGGNRAASPTLVS